MNRKKSFELNEAMHNKIISVAYGDAGLMDRIKIMRAAAENEEVRNLLDEYKKTALEVKILELEEFPQELLKAVESKTVSLKKNTNTFFYDLYSVILSRPGYSAAVTIVLVAAMVISLIINKPVQYNYSAAEINVADKQAKYAFEIVGKIFNETNITLQKEVLGKAVAKPLNESIGVVNKLIKGDKNEIN
ncbi:MAG: hypothetical protein ACYC4T_01250 [Melioribacteraceae bacterium]